MINYKAIFLLFENVIVLMFDKDKIQFSDIQSEDVPIEQYISENGYDQAMDKYIPEENILEDIKQILAENKGKIRVKVFGASWCKDCRNNIPKLGKISKVLGSKLITMGVLGTIKVKAPFQRKEGEFMWKSPPSPSETLDPRFDMLHIPAAFIFKNDGKCIGKIDENPTHTKTLEGDILHYMKNNI